MEYHISFSIENDTFLFTRITHLFSRFKCQMVHLQAKQVELSKLAVDVTIRVEQKMYDQFIIQLNNTIGVMNVKCNVNEKVAVF